jgi:Protein of unknown function (DUF3102)
LESVLASAKGKLPVRSKADFLESLEGEAANLPTINPRPVIIEVQRTDLKTVDDYAAVIGTLFREAEERFVQIGTFLEEAKAKLQHGEFQRLISSRLPFGSRTAQMMMAAARAITSGMIPSGIVPPSYSVVYQITTLTEAEREQAVEEGVIRPNMRREDVAAFKRRIRTAGVSEIEAKRAELVRLIVEQERIGARIAALRAELGE